MEQVKDWKPTDVALTQLSGPMAAGRVKARKQEKRAELARAASAQRERERAAAEEEAARTAARDKLRALMARRSNRGGTLLTADSGGLVTLG